MKLYKIRDWSDLFENNRSRELKQINWVLVPNRHDGENFSAIMAHKNGAEIFSAWVLMLQVASKCDPRGTLLRGGKKPHDSSSLALKTRAPKKWFDLALEFLEKETDWITAEPVTDQLELIPQEGAGIPQASADSSLPFPSILSVPSGGGCKGEGRAKSVEDVKAYCVEIGLPETDGAWFWDKCVGCGWMNAGKPIKDWKATIRAWKSAGYLASQKNHKTNGHSTNGVSGVDKVSMNGEADRIRGHIQEIRLNYPGHMTISDEDQSKINKMSERLREIKKILGNKY